jgi:hypothetical protein
MIGLRLWAQRCFELQANRARSNQKGCDNVLQFRNVPQVRERRWISRYRARLGDVPPLEMLVQTKHKPDNTTLRRDVPSYRGCPLKLFAKLIRARVSLWLGRSRGRSASTKPRDGPSEKFQSETVPQMSLWASARRLHMIEINHGQESSV